MTYHLTPKFKRVLGRGAVALTLAVSAGSTFLAGAGTALAPEPAKLKVALTSSRGAVAAAVYVNSTTATTVRYYSSGWVADGTGPAAGTPCSTTSLMTDAVSRQVIQRTGSYARCI